MSNQLPQHVGREVFNGYRCTYDAGDGLCTEMAVLHVFWTEDGENGFTCSDHFEDALAFGGVDSHPMETACAARPSRWFPSTEHMQGYCSAEPHPDLTTDSTQRESRPGSEVTE